MATGNEYGLVWMNQNDMMMPQGSPMPQVSPDIMPMDQSHSGLDGSYYPMPVPPAFDSVSQQAMELDGFLMMDELDSDYCGEPPRYMTAATQTVQSVRKKIRPVKHPGLKLQTPIAYKCDTDPSVIPIQKDGMAICEKCGAIGVKHAFYTRYRKYCSLACARGSLLPHEVKEMKEEDDSFQSQENSNSSFGAYPNGTPIDDKELVTKEILPLAMGPIESLPSFNVGPGMGTFTFPGLSVPDDPVPPIQSIKVKHELSLSFDWTSKLSNPDIKAVPVNCFKHAPMSDCWDDITAGMKVEVENSDYEEIYDFPDSFWVATVIRVAGYMALLRFEGFTESDRDFWVNLCCSSVHPVGWCATRGKPLIPPKSIAEKFKDWKEFLVNRLTGARTLPTNFYSKVHESLKSRFRLGLNVEVVDKTRISQVCVASVKRVVGKRLHVMYYNAEEDDSGFWCHEDSPLLHPVGWAVRVGHEIDAPVDYMYRCDSGLIEKDDASDELFTAPFQSVTTDGSSNASDGFEQGMKLEAIDPLNLSAICASTVMKVLKDGYLMIRIDGYPMDADGSDWFCYHAHSPYIFPPGFCSKNGISLIPPMDYSQETFSWDQLVADTGCVLAPESLFPREIPDHGFEAGMHVESADLMDPRLVCVAAVSRVVGRLLKVHFDGWGEEFDQWLDCRSPDLYPVGWCSLVSHKLEAPANPQKSILTDKKKPGRRKKTKGKIKVTQPKKGSAPTPGCSIPDSASTLNPSDPVREEPCRTVAESTGAVESVTTTTPAEQVVEPPPASSVPSSSGENSQFIPRLSDGSSGCDSNLNPSAWTTDDVTSFLRLNDCSAHADKFCEAGTDGPTLLTLTEDQIMALTGFKIGPTLKIYDLIQQLKMKAAKASMKKNL